MITKDLNYIKQYWQYLLKYKFTLSIGIALIPTITLCHLVQPVIIKIGIDDVILKGDLPGLYSLTIWLGLCIFLEFVCRALQSFLFQYIGQKTITDIRSDLFDHVTHLSSSYFDKTPLGRVTTRLTSDMEALNESFSSGLVTLIGDLLTFVGIIIFMFLLSPPLTGVTLLVIPPLAFLSNFFRKKLRYYFQQIRSNLSKLNARLQEDLNGIDMIQIFERRERNLTQFKHTNNRYRLANIGSVTYDALLYSLIEALSSIMVAIMIWYGWGQYHQDMVTIGLLVAFIEYINRLFQPLKELSNKFAILQHALVALERIFGTLNGSDHISSGKTSLTTVQGSICFKNISFAYPGHEDKPILKDLSFSVKPGQILALVGPTGSGKTTVARLLTRLYTGYTGAITIDNHDITTLTTASLREQIATVTQDIHLFSDTVNFNIGLNNPAISKDDIIQAAKLTQAHDIILSLPNGYDTRLQQQGQQLSVGQAQLISFARAMASHAPILLLDEATASIDSLSEKLIQKAIQSLLKEKTVIVIAHRLSTIQKADKILALKDGQIIESGTHEELIQQDGFYKRLYQLQFSKKEIG